MKKKMGATAYFRLTYLENEVIQAYKKDDFVQDRGWDDPEAGAWVKGFHQDCGMSGKEFSGVMSSLVKKGWCWTDGEAFGLTEEAIATLKEYEGGETK